MDDRTPSRRTFLRQALGLVVVTAAAPSVVLARLTPDLSTSAAGGAVATYRFRLADVSGALDNVGDSIRLVTPASLMDLNPDHVNFKDLSQQGTRGRYPIAVTRVAESGLDAFKSVSTYCTHGDGYQIGDFDSSTGWFECPHKQSRYLADGTRLAGNGVPGGNLRVFPTTFDGEWIVLDGVNPIAGMTNGVESDEIPARVFLDQNWPNPFVGTTAIRFGLPDDTFVRLSIHSAFGQQITVLKEGVMEAGVHREIFNAAGLPSGIYFYRLQTRAFGTLTRRMTVTR